MQVVGARLGDHVDDPAQRPSILRAKAVIDHAKFADRFLRRRSALRARGFVDVVGAVDRYRIAQVAHPAEGDAGDFRLGKRGLDAGSAGGHARSEQREVDELPPIHRKRLNLGGANHLADFGTAGFDRRRLRGHGDRLAYGCYLERFIQGRGLPHGQNKSGLHRLGEARRHHGDFVRPGQKVGDDIETVPIGGSSIGAVGGLIAQRDRGSRDHLPARIEDRSTKLSVADGRLTECTRRPKRGYRNHPHSQNQTT